MPNQTPTRRQSVNGHEPSRTLVGKQARGRRSARQVRTGPGEAERLDRGQTLQPGLRPRVVDAARTTDAAALRSAAAEHFRTHMTFVSVASLAGIALMYHGTVGGTSGHWTGGMALIAGSGGYGLIMQRRLLAVLVVLFGHEGHGATSAKARAKAELAKIIHRTPP